MLNPVPNSGPHPLSHMLPHPVPDSATARLVLVAARRMAAFGLHDASGALLMMQGFGLHFRKPLCLLRAFMLELSQTAERPISLAPCCSLRMTEQEHALMQTLATAARDPSAADMHLRALTGARHIEGLLATARVLSAAVAESGRSLTG